MGHVRMPERVYTVNHVRPKSIGVTFPDPRPHTHNQHLPRINRRKISIMQKVRFYSIRFPLFLARAPVLIVPRLVALLNGTKIFLHFGLVIIAVCTALDNVFLVSFDHCYARPVWYPADPAKLETPNT